MFSPQKLVLAVCFIVSNSNVFQAYAQSGNAITKPEMNEKIPVGKEYIVTWTPTTKGTITLFLLYGPASNLLEKIDTLARNIENSGTYSWVPSTSLVEDSHYGINLTVDADPSSFQYSNPFSIINSNVKENQPISSSDTSQATISPAQSSTSSAVLTSSTNPAPVVSSTPNNATPQLPSSTSADQPSPNNPKASNASKSSGTSAAPSQSTVKPITGPAKSSASKKLEEQFFGTTFGLTVSLIITYLLA